MRGKKEEKAGFSRMSESMEPSLKAFRCKSPRGCKGWIHTDKLDNREASSKLDSRGAGAKK